MLESALKFILTLIFGYIYGVPVMLFRFYKANKAGYRNFPKLYLPYTVCGIPYTICLYINVVTVFTQYPVKVV